MSKHLPELCHHPKQCWLQIQSRFVLWILISRFGDQKTFAKWWTRSSREFESPSRVHSIATAPFPRLKIALLSRRINRAVLTQELMKWKCVTWYQRQPFLTRHQSNQTEQRNQMAVTSPTRILEGFLEWNNVSLGISPPPPKKKQKKQALSLSLWQICSHWQHRNLLRCGQRWRWQSCRYDITFFSLQRM